MTLLILLITTPVAIALIISIASRLITRANQRRRAQEAFSRYLKAIFEWSADRTNLSLTAQAMQSIDEHSATLEQWREARTQNYRLQRTERDFLTAYVKLQHRHNQMLKVSVTTPQNEDTTLALTFRDAVLSLTANGRLA